MLLAAKAWHLRQAARQAIQSGDLSGGLQLASLAQGTQRTTAGDEIQKVGRLLESLLGTVQ